MDKITVRCPTQIGVILSQKNAFYPIKQKVLPEKYKSKPVHDIFMIVQDFFHIVISYYYTLDRVSFKKKNSNKFSKNSILC